MSQITALGGLIIEKQADFASAKGEQSGLLRYIGMAAACVPTFIEPGPTIIPLTFRT